MKVIISVLLCGLLLGCGGPKKKGSFDTPSISNNQYDSLINKYTKSVEEYNGFQNLYNIKATILNTKVYSAMIDRQRHNKQLSTADTQRLREKAFRQMSTETHFFVSYFSPERSLRHLDRGDALWKVYLERDGRRFEANISKYPGIKYDIQSLFGYHSRWSRGYLLKFKIPTSTAESSEVKLIFSSSAGKAEFVFPPVN